jgi:hypothetical protein
LLVAVRYFFFLPAFFFAVFLAAFFFVAMLRLLQELTKGTALQHRGPCEPGIQPPGEPPEQSNSSTTSAVQGREPDGNGHAAAGFRAVRGAGDGTVGAGACTAGATGAATNLTAFLAGCFGFAFGTARFTFARLAIGFALRAAPAFFAFFATRRTLPRAADFFTARFTFARFTPRFGLARAAAFFFLPAFVAMSMLPSV